ncbi:ATP-binding protein [Piscinibacter sp. HJYY11]|uniref:ATP-binding protein n=1 Tax=Piscinibacter sp. HJYY11 TaxID=2801333 RepID=UPI00191DC02B|nr:ATP-binding protein [Piscinibacter sp. HJYY11]MBL0726461.1 response regulator [Piscinibacter sp. HJYY11]
MARVLVVDDHATNRDLIATLLGYAGHQVDEAADGAEALEKVRTTRPALVICDILMPTMDGYEFARRLREEPGIAATEVIFWTATFMESEARKLAASCGVHQILFKPCEPQDVLDVVQAALAGQGPTGPAVTVDDFDREHLRLVTDKLVAQSNELLHANERLSALTELNLRLASERDPVALLDQVCRGARDLIGARYAILGVRQKDDAETVHYATWGFDPEAAGGLGQSDLAAGVLGTVMLERTPRRFFNPSGDPVRLGLPANCPPLTSGLVAPVVSLHQSYGWILLIDKVGQDTFGDEDEHLLAIHAAQAGRIYENGSLYLAMKHNAEQLQIANETLEQRVEGRTAQLRDIIGGLESFNRTVSHDLRGPLGGIAGASRKACEYLANGQTERASQMLGLIAASAERTEALVNALLALARSSETELQRQRVDTQALVREAVAAVPQAAGRTPVAFSIGTLPEVDADPTLLRQVFVNLITNAAKFAAAAPAPQVEVGAAEEGGHTVFHVRDNGVGFGPEQAQRLFQPFQRLHGAKYEGFGLGLSIVKRIVERHQGRIWAEGRPGQGATFYFSVG